jgi:capsular exopolysaccharide synthesis family protein
MSKNFELMQDAIRLQIPEGRQTKSSSSAYGEAHIAGKRVIAKLEDDMTRKESHKLVQSIFLLRREDSPKVVAFSGIDSGNGCSWICAQAALILAGQKVGTVCLVDANLRSPSLPELFGVTNHFGLTDALAKDGSIRDFTKAARSDNLCLLSCGSRASESSGLLNSETMKARVAELRTEFDYVLIDSPPLNTYSDGMAVGQLADGVVLILEANSTRRETATKVTETLRAAQIKILAAVLNKRTFPIPGFLYDRL